LTPRVPPTYHNGGPSTAQLERANRLLGEEIGHRQRAEAALREANAELERRVSERTADLQEEVLRRRATEETLRASEARWRSMFEASAVGITVMDQNNHFAAANEAFERMVGYTGDELRSLGPLDITHEDDREAAREMIENVQSGKREDYQAEKRYRRKDGTVIWVRVSTARALDPESPHPVRLYHDIVSFMADVAARLHAAWHVLSLAAGTDCASCRLGFTDCACLLFDSDCPDLFCKRQRVRHHLPDRDSRADGEHSRDRFDAAVEPIVRILQGPHTHDMRGAAGKNKEP
jgi:PAS domain S-box-containing protein